MVVSPAKNINFFFPAVLFPSFPLFKFLLGEQFYFHLRATWWAIAQWNIPIGELFYYFFQNGGPTITLLFACNTKRLSLQGIIELKNC